MAGYNQRQWNIDTSGLTGNFEGIAKILDATLPYLNAVQAGQTQVSGAITLADEGRQRARSGEDLRTRWNATFRDLNSAAAATRGDRAEDKRYAQ